MNTQTKPYRGHRITTFRHVLGRLDITAPDEALADIEVPVLTGPQRQGDVGIFPRPPLGKAEPAGGEVPAEGLAIVRGEATGNTHILMPDHDSEIAWAPHDATDPSDVLLGILNVPDGATAWLIHTDEHGVNGVGAGCYRITCKREMADQIRRVAD